MVRSSLARISAGGFSILLSAALLFMIGGLIASDRAMREDAIARTRTDAQQSALAVEQVLQAHLRDRGTLRDVASDSAFRAVVATGPAERAAAAVIAGADTLLL